MKGKNVKWYVYFFLGLCAFMGLGIEALYVYLIEPVLYGHEMGQWTTTQIIIHWILTCITWGLVVAMVQCRHMRDFLFGK